MYLDQLQHLNVYRHPKVSWSSQSPSIYNNEKWSTEEEHNFTPPKVDGRGCQDWQYRD